jgi:hypothetical protein
MEIFKMASKIKKLTPSLLRKIVLEERRRIMETSDPVAAGIEDPEKVSAEEVDADDQANTLEKDIDHIKALKIQEARLRNKLKKVRRARTIARSKFLKKL